MKKHLLTILMMGLAVCLVGCTDDAGDEGSDETAEGGITVENIQEAAAAGAAAVEEVVEEAVEEAGEAVAMTLAKLDGVDVEAGCAKCAYKLADECMLGMKVGDDTYIVEGTDIISDDVGLCSGHRPAKVTGVARDETHFVAASWAFTDE